MSERFDGQVAVVTGGTAGVGRATVRELAERGADVAILARDDARLEATRREVEAKGRRALALSVDVSDAGAVDAAAALVEEELGPIDVWVNNAMTSVFAPFLEIEPDEYRRVTEVTYLGFVYGTRAALRRMKPRDRGVIVQVGSVLAYRGIPLQSAYSGAKHAIEGFTESLRSELIHDGSNVKLSMVQMPALNTPQFDWVRSRLPNRAQPVPPIYQPEIAADAIAWAAAHAPREKFVGWRSGPIIWLNRLLPGLGDRYLARTGFEGQQTDELADADRPDNLYEPVEGTAFAAHGAFDGRAREISPQWWAAKHRRALTAGVVGLGAVVGAALIGRNGGRR